MDLRLPLFLLAALGLLGACVSTSLSLAEAKRVSDACRAEVNPVGSYSISQDRDGTPRARPLTTASRLVAGTEAEAATLNACFQRRAGAAVPAVAGVPQTSTVTTDGRTTTETFTYGTPPAAPPASPRATARPAPETATLAGCTRGMGVLQGGTRYCVSY